MARKKSGSSSPSQRSRIGKGKSRADPGRRRWDLSGWVLIILLVVVIIFFYSFYKRSAVVSEKDLSSAPVRIQILNGCGEKGITELVEGKLKSQAGNVIYYVVDRDNAESFGFPQTLVVDRAGNREAALELAKALGVSSRNIVTQKLADNLLDVDFTIIVGGDYGDILGP